MNKQLQPIDPTILEIYRMQAKELGPGPLQELIDHIDYLEQRNKELESHNKYQESLILKKELNANATSENGRTNPTTC